LGAELLRRLVVDKPLDEGGQLCVDESSALSVVGGRENVANSIEGGFESSDGSVILEVVLSEAYYELANAAAGLKGLMSYNRLNSRSAQTGLGAELLGRLVVDKPLDEGGQLRVDESSALSVVGGRENVANSIDGGLESSDGSVILEVVLSEAYYELANAAASLKGLCELRKSLLGGAKVKLLADYFGILLVGNPLNDFRSVLIDFLFALNKLEHHTRAKYTKEEYGSGRKVQVFSNQLKISVSVLLLRRKPSTVWTTNSQREQVWAEAEDTSRRAKRKNILSIR
jgi:hypothetical protein